MIYTDGGTRWVTVRDNLQYDNKQGVFWMGAAFNLTDSLNVNLSSGPYAFFPVPHGDAPTGKFPAWVPYVAKQLDCLKYDATIPFDWSQLAAIPKPGLAVDLMAKRVLDTMKQVAPQGSWDLQLIGHSRGGTIISLTMDKLVKSNSPLLTGYKRLTYLDSHPANAGTDSLFNYRPQPTPGKLLAGRVAYGFAKLLQHSINDPSSFVPQGVDYAEAYFQKSLAWKVQCQPQEAILNLWGQNNVPTNGPAVNYVDVTADGMSHTGVWRLYANSITQTLPTSLRTQTTFVPNQPYNFQPLPPGSLQGDGCVGGEQSAEGVIGWTTAVIRLRELIRLQLRDPYPTRTVGRREESGTAFWRRAKTLFGTSP